MKYKVNVLEAYIYVPVNVDNGFTENEKEVFEYLCLNCNIAKGIYVECYVDEFVEIRGLSKKQIKDVFEYVKLKWDKSTIAVLLDEFVDEHNIKEFETYEEFIKKVG